MSDLPVIPSSNTLDNIRHNYTERAKVLLKRTVEATLDLARLCAAAKAEMGYTVYMDWIMNDLGYSDEWGKTMYRIAERWGGYEQLPENLSATVLSYLARPTTPDEVVSEFTQRAESGEKVKVEDVRAAIRDAKSGVDLKTLADEIEDRAPDEIKNRVLEQHLSIRQAHDLMIALEQTTPAVRQIALEHGVTDARVVPVLERIEKTMPEQFEDMAISGYLPAEGERAEPISLADANGRDAEDLYKQTRIEHGLVDWEARRALRTVSHTAFIRDVLYTGAGVEMTVYLPGTPSSLADRLRDIQNAEVAQFMTLQDARQE